MADPTSIAQIDLSPIPGKKYFDITREWREEFIYFLLVDRFHDGRNRQPNTGPARTIGSGTFNQLSGVCGGNLKGVKNHLDYIHDLGCTAIWLSPVLENNPADPGTYHGYAIENYLGIDPRFGTKQDLVDLVAAAHALDLRVFLDAVINHSGDVWAYPNDNPYFYWNDQQFPFGTWRKNNRPLPSELRDPDLFHRKGQIRNWDSWPEYEHGDFYGSKDWAHEDDVNGARLMNALVAAHCYWIREADIDGFRMDAVKHLSQLATARFASAVREYAYKLGKHSFLTFGELIAGDDAINLFIGPDTATNTGGSTVFFGIESVLDFPLYFCLPGTIKGLSSPAGVIARYEAQRKRALNMGPLGQYLVTFLDNHDGIGQDIKRRYGAGAFDGQIIGGIGFLLCALGTTCIYYGTEQGFSGVGQNKDDDKSIREAMFDLNDPTKDMLNKQCRIYQEIAKISNLTDVYAPLKFGRMYLRQVSGDGINFGLPQGQPCTLAFSRLLADQEVLVAYNTSTTANRNDAIIVDANIQTSRASMSFIYGGVGSVPIQKLPDPSNPTRFVRLNLAPMQFVILQ